jgi:serine/threonine-protein kinase RsbW
MSSLLQLAPELVGDPGGASQVEWRCDQLSTPAGIEPCLQRLVAEMTGCGFPERDLFAVRLALEEAVVNALKHGHQGDPSKVVRVRWCVTGKQVLLIVEDEGPGFRLEDVPDPLCPENLERSTGRGVFLMRHYMTWVEYNERGNAVTLCKKQS